MPPRNAPAQRFRSHSRLDQAQAAAADVARLTSRRTLLLATVSMHCWHIIAAVALPSTQQTHDALGGALRGGTRPTARRPHGNSINISSFSPRCHTRHTNRSIVNFDFFLFAPHLDMSDDEIVLDVTKEDGRVKQKRVQRDATVLSVRFLFRFVVASRDARSPQLGDRQLVAVSDNIVQLTHVTKLEVRLFLFSCRCFDASNSSGAAPSPRSRRVCWP